MLEPHEVGTQFTAALDGLGLEATRYVHLAEAMELSSTRIIAARQAFDNELATSKPPIDVVAFGSMARYEMTPESDFDYLVVAYGLDAKPGAYQCALTIADRLRSTLGEFAGETNALPIREPGASGLFGTMVSAPDLVEVIGLERDTNHSHSRRVLLLEESVSLYNPRRHAFLLEAMIDRYLEARPPSASGMPRFLLNDLARYWRTLSVDYQAKTRPPVRYSLRYIKLLTSRKLAYASALAPLVTAVTSGHADLRAALLDAYGKPPVLRMLDLAATLRSVGDEGAVQAVAAALEVSDRFTSLLGQADWRKRIEDDCRRDDPRVQETFGAARELARQLQEELEKVFFSKTIAPVAMKYLTF